MIYNRFSMETELEPQVVQPYIPNESLQTFIDVRTFLANLYVFSLRDRPHLKTKKGLASVEATRMNAIEFVNDVNLWHIWLVTFMVRFQEDGWKQPNYEYPPPKLIDVTLLSLVKHAIFGGQDVKDIVKNSFKLNSKENKVLKELALRLCP